MITTERLEELVNQEATAWGCDGKSVFDLPLKSTKDRMVAFVGKCCLIVDWYAGKSKGWLTAHYNLGQLYETEEQAKWALRTIGKRIEKFEPPMWEDIEDKYEFYFTCQDYKSKSSNPCGMFVVNKKGTLKNYILVRNVSHYPNIFTFDEPATKENYEKACEIVRDLFNKGDKE